MTFRTKLILTNDTFAQPSGGTLTLKGSTLIDIAATGITATTQAANKAYVDYSIAISNTITGVTNGLSLIGSKDARLGGVLNRNTVIDAGVYDLTIDAGNITTGTTLLRADIGASTNEPLIRFKNKSTNNATAGFVDINIGTCNINQSSQAWGNIAIGFNSLRSICAISESSGGRNIALGFNVGSSLISGTTSTSGGASNNILLGKNALTTSTQGAYNVVVGYGAAECTTNSLRSSIAIGTFAGRYFNNNQTSDSCFQTIIGGYAANSANQICDKVTFIGYNAAKDASNVASFNMFIGDAAGRKACNLGQSNTVLGAAAGYGIEKATRSTILGYGAARKSSGATDGTFVGTCAGFSIGCARNTAIGFRAGRALNAGANTVGTLLRGSDNTFIGSSASFSTTTPTISETIVIGNDFQGNESNKIFLASKGAVKLIANHDTVSGSTEFRNTGFYYNDDYSTTGKNNPRWIPDNAYITGLTSGITGNFNDLDGANGITRVGNDFVLGGKLTGTTTISGNSQIFKLGTNASKLSAFDIISNGASTIQTVGGLDILNSGSDDLVLAAQNSTQLIIKSQTGATAGADFTGGVGFDLDVNNNIFTIVDNRGTPRGIQYLTNYSNGFTDRSLVDKGYVDSVAAGLDPIASVKYATNQDIDLTGGTFGGTIDGATVSDGDRVLVKDQNDATENGIYVYDSANNEFNRSADFDDSPDGEVSAGALIPVTSGNTNNDTSWILTTNDPIDLGISELNFSLFSKILNVVGGTGITVTTVGAARNVSIDLAPNSGLDFNSASDSGELKIASTFAGLGSNITTGVLDLNVENASATGTEINVQINTGGTNVLMVDSDDILAAIGGADTLTASNGLTRDVDDFQLGGTLNRDTKIDTSTGYTFVIGNSNSTATGDTAIAIGKSAYAFGDSNIAIGESAFSSGLQSIALGFNSFADGTRSTALSTGTAIGYNSLAGIYGVACGNFSTAIGNGYTSSIACFSTAIVRASACGEDSFAAGFQATVNGDCSFSLGNLSITDGLQSFTIGNNVRAVANKSIAIGNGANFNRCLATNGYKSINISTNDSSQIAGYGVNAKYGAIFGGLNHNIQSGNTGATVVGGYNINLTGTTYVDHTAVSKLAIMDQPVTGATGDTVLVRNSSTGIIREITQSSLVNNSIQANNGLSVDGGVVVLGGTLNRDTKVELVNYGLDLSKNGVIGSASTRSHILGGTSNKIIGNTRDNAIINGYLSCIENLGGNSFFGWNNVIGELNTVKQFQVGGNGRISNSNVMGYQNRVCLSGGSNVDIFNPTAIGVKNCILNLNEGRFNNQITFGAYNISRATAAMAIQSNACAYSKGALAIGFNEGSNIFGAGGGQGVLASGYRAINISTNNASQIVNQGATAARSAIFAGLNSHIATGNTNAVLIGGLGIKLTGSSYIDHTVVSNLAIYNTPTGGSTSDSVLVRDATTGIIKEVTQDSISGVEGSKNNIYDTTGVTSITATTDLHVLLVDTSGSPQTITLPANPMDGQTYKIKDKGNALTNNITIEGNGNNIDGDTSAIINTNYGGFEIVYHGVDAQWYVLSFYN